jgi:hypothetical protein
VAVFAVPVCWIVARANDVVPGEAASDVDAAAAPDQASDAESQPSLGRTIHLQFKIVGPEETPTFAIVCAARTFLLKHDIAEVNHGHTMTLSGELSPTDDAEHVFLTFKAQNSHSDPNEGFDANFTAEGSAILTLGKELKLADLGGDPLLLTATVEE